MSHPTFFYPPPLLCFYQFPGRTSTASGGANVNCAIIALLYPDSIGNQLSNMMVVFKMRGSVPSAKYSSVCNVLRLWRIWLIPTYRVYLFYDIIIIYIRKILQSSTISVGFAQARPNYYLTYSVIFNGIINPRRVIAARFTVVVSCVCLYVCPHTVRCG